MVQTSNSSETHCHLRLCCWSVRLFVMFSWREHTRMNASNFGMFRRRCVVEVKGCPSAWCCFCLPLGFCSVNELHIRQLRGPRDTQNNKFVCSSSSSVPQHSYGTGTELLRVEKGQNGFGIGDLRNTGCLGVSECCGSAAPTSCSQLMDLAGCGRCVSTPSSISASSISSPTVQISSRLHLDHGEPSRVVGRYARTYVGFVPEQCCCRTNRSGPYCSFRFVSSFRLDEG